MISINVKARVSMREANLDDRLVNLVLKNDEISVKLRKTQCFVKENYSNYIKIYTDGSCLYNNLSLRPSAFRN